MLRSFLQLVVLASLFGFAQPIALGTPGLAAKHRASRAKTKPFHQKFRPGANVGRGDFKAVHAVRGNPKLVVLSQWRNLKANTVNTITHEIRSLERLRSMGIPTVEVIARGKDKYGKPAMVQKRYAASNRDKKTYWQFVSRRTLRDLKQVHKKLVAEKITLTDFQFLVDARGGVVLNDPGRLVRSANGYTGVRSYINSVESHLDMNGK